MIEAHDSRTVRAAEAPLLAAGVPLMEHAASALATSVLSGLRTGRGTVRGGRVTLLVGAGSNGGDALLAGAQLLARGATVTAVLLDARVHADGLAAFTAAGGEVLPVAAPVPHGRRTLLACEADVLVDAIVGIGGTGGLRGPAGDVVRDVADQLARTAPGDRRPLVVAVDAPSGIGVDDGTVPHGPDGAAPAVLHADRTVTFGAPTPGLLLPPAAAYVGALEVVDLGLDLDQDGRPHCPETVRRLEGADLVRLRVLAEPAHDGHKYTRGVLGVVAGTDTFPGAAVLAVSGAVRTGTGMVRYLGPAGATTAVLARHPEAVPAGGRVQAWALGPGLPSAPEPADEVSRAQRSRVRQALAQATGELASDIVGEIVPAVVDAGALTLLPERCPPSVVLTPHAGELAALLRSRGEDVERADVEAEPLRWATRARDLTGATVLLKGAVTVVAGPLGVYAQADGSPWLATAGAGDVLTGILGALLATRSADAVKDPGLPAVLAASAALLHGRAAHRANPGGPVSALDVADAVPGTVAALLRGEDA